MIKLNRGQIGKKAGIDVTVRANLAVSPTWEYVMAFKSGTIGEREYTDWYMARLDSRRDEVFAWASKLPEETTFLCFCPLDAFCHTYLLIDWLVVNYPKTFCRAEV